MVHESHSQYSDAYELVVHNVEVTDGRDDEGRDEGIMWCASLSSGWGWMLALDCRSTMYIYIYLAVYPKSNLDVRSSGYRERGGTND